MVRFIENSLSFDQLNISRADIPCVLNNDVGEGARSTQPVTLYITVNITPPNLYNSPSIPTKDNDSPAEEANIPRPIQFPTPERLLPLSHRQPVETGNTMPQSREEMSPTSTEDPRFALDRADESMKQIVPIDGSNTWERGRRENQVGNGYVGPNCGSARDTLLMSFAELTSPLQLSPFAKMAHGLLLAIPKVRPFVSLSERDVHAIFVWMIDAPRTVST